MKEKKTIFNSIINEKEGITRRNFIKNTGIFTMGCCGLMGGLIGCDVTSYMGLKHHALFFTCVAEKLNISTDNSALLKDVIYYYGERIGRRTRDSSDNHTYGDVHYNDSLLGFMVFSEAPSDKKLLGFQPSMTGNHVLDTTVCDWNDAWVEKDKRFLGINYCKHIDTAVLNGFLYKENSREVTLEVKRILGVDGSKYCRLDYDGWPCLNVAELILLVSLRKKYSGLNSKPGEYCVADLYDAFSKFIPDEAILEDALLYLSNMLSFNYDEAQARINYIRNIDDIFTIQGIPIL
ncbi:MAG: hypothetical protein GY874_10890 [Desulfobacteraceae bacterium]|nr:hypothetical protein [Desulfobacteraceae bacterium]